MEYFEQPYCRSRHSPRHCPVLADAIASQLVRNGKYEAVDRKSSRLVSQEVSDLWRATTPDAINISDKFSQREFTAALQHLKPGKAPGPDSICSELILHAGDALKSWLRDFLSSCLRRLKIPKIWRRALVVAISKPGKPWGTQRVIDRYLCSVSPTRLAKKKAGAVFINLTAAYDTVWHRGLTYKLLRLLPDKHMVKMIMELV